MAILKVKTKYGVVAGTSASNPELSVFKGIPFAKPPVGELRYAAPQEPEAWEGERVCDRFAPDCIQEQRGESFPMSEDCLYLNVYTPANSADEKLPVMFWIFGGGFTGGRVSLAENDGEAMNKRGVILVSINYRCNIMGFCALPELEKKNGIAVNAGILDQIAALKWVRENIGCFGGDPDRILVFGQSAGGVSTRMLLTSDLSRGMFSRAIIQSGGGLNEADLVRPREEFMNLCRNCMEHLGWTFEDMMTRDAVEISKKMQEAAREAAGGHEVGYFQPFIDGYTLKEVPGKLIHSGAYMDIPIICGTVAGDSWMFTRKVREELQGNNHFFRGFSYSPGLAWARHQLKTKRTPIYAFYMDRSQPPEDHPHFRNGQPPYGASTSHGTDVAYVFGTIGTRKCAYVDYDYELSDAMVDYWTNFAKNGDPNGGSLPYWPLYTEETPLTMHFGDNGYRAENVVLTKEEERTLDYTEAHPGMLTSVEGL